MSLGARDVISKKTEHTFTDDNTKDIKSSRNCLIITDDVNGQPYYLTMASHDNNAFEFYQLHKETNYLLKKKNCEGLDRTSCINLAEIYEGEPLGKLVVIIPEREYELIIEKFKECQLRTPHPHYERIKNYI